MRLHMIWNCHCLIQIDHNWLKKPSGWCEPSHGIAFSRIRKICDQSKIWSINAQLASYLQCAIENQHSHAIDQFYLDIQDRHPPLVMIQDFRFQRNGYNLEQDAVFLLPFQKLVLFPYIYIYNIVSKHRKKVEKGFVKGLKVAMRKFALNQQECNPGSFGNGVFGISYEWAATWPRERPEFLFASQRLLLDEKWCLNGSEL